MWPSIQAAATFGFWTPAWLSAPTKVPPRGLLAGLLVSTILPSLPYLCHLANIATVTHEDSSTFEVTYPDSFDITYGDGTSAQGDYFADTIRFGGEAIKSQTMGIAYNSTLSPGLLGLGYTTNEASVAQEPPFTYPSIVDNMFNDGLISVKAYSLYLDDLHSSTGSLLFGGLDSDKYQGNLVQMPIVPYGTTRNGNAYYTAFDVNMVSLGVTKGSGKSTKFGTGDYNIATNLDSGTTLSYVPSSLFDAILEEFGGEEDAGSGLAFIPCSVRDNKELTFDFELGEDKTIVIKVPAAEMIYDSGPILDSYEPSISIDDACILGFISQPGGPYLLGDNFLRSAYVVYDLQNNFIAVGQTNFDSTTSSIVDFPADATEIPMKSGVATSPVREPSHESTGPATTANSGSQTTANGGSRTAANGGIDTRSANDSPGSPQPTGDDNKNPAVAPRPLELGGLAVLGVSMMFTLVGGGLFLVY